MELSLEKKVLYANTFCRYRKPMPYKVACTHPWSFGICDLDLCPIVQNYFANVIFTDEGIVLIYKSPSNSRVAGEIKRIRLDVRQDNEHEVIELVKRTVKGINEKNLEALVERIHRIYERYRFLLSKGIRVPVLEGVEEHEEGEEEGGS